MKRLEQLLAEQAGRVKKLETDAEEILRLLFQLTLFLNARQENELKNEIESREEQVIVQLCLSPLAVLITRP